MCMYVCMHKHVRLGGSGGMLPQEKLDVYKIAIFGQKQTRISYMTHRVLHLILVLVVHICNCEEAADIEFPR